jgi:hypothetical protein
MTLSISQKLSRIEKLRLNHAPMIGERELEKIQKRLQSIEHVELPYELPNSFKFIKASEQLKNKQSRLLRSNRESATLTKAELMPPDSMAVFHKQREMQVKNDMDTLYITRLMDNKNVKGSVLLTTSVPSMLTGYQNVHIKPGTVNLNNKQNRVVS